MWKWITAAAAVLIIVPLTLVIVIAGSTPSPTAPIPGEPSEEALSDIPAALLVLYQDAAATCPGLGWNVLAAVGKVESDHNRDPSSRVPNSASAIGPMQFLPATFATYGVDGDSDGKKDITNPADAIFSAAHYLCASGAGTDTRKAPFAYNHAWWYVDKVLAEAARYITPTAPGSSELVTKILDYALAQRGKPYIWGGTGPTGYDCSGLPYMAYQSVGLAIPRTTFEQWPFGKKIPAGTEQAGDLVFFNAGPGSGPNNPGHVAMVISPGQMIEARCRLCGPIKVTTYRNRPIMGFTRPLATSALTRSSKPAH